MNSASAHTCLSNDTLELLARDATVETVHAEHLVSCEPCRAALERVRRNNAFLSGMVDDLRQGSSAAPAACESPLQFPGYRVLGEIHRGGQGVVYKALQDATRRKVAIKTLLHGAAATGKQRRRFEREIEIVSNLRHPNIVTVYESLTTDDDSVAYSMEYIHGQTIEQWSAKLPKTPAGVRERMRIFAKVCDAVRYAHQRGVIHRDLKPGNILIDDDGEPHVLDFGLAKLQVGSGGYDPTMTGEFVGSIGYAAPEQVQGAPEQIDTRTDVYALGVVLYQMLTGSFPYAVHGAMRDTLDNILSAAPPPPRVSCAGVDDEVDTIVMTCLAKERERRYQSASELADDVERYLVGEPIAAKRDSMIYLLRKQIRKYRLSAAVTSAFAAVVIVGLLVSISQWRRADAQRRRAEQAETLAAQRLTEQQQVVQYLADDLLSVFNPARAAQLRSAFGGPAQGGGAAADELSVARVLESAATMVDEREGYSPLARAAIQQTLGKMHQQLGRYAQARALFEKALATREKLLGPRDPETAAAMANLANAAAQSGDAEQAETLLRRALAIQSELADGADEAHELQAQLARLLVDQGRDAEAEPLLDAVIGAGHEAGQEAYYVAYALNGLAKVRQRQGRLAEAEQLHKNALNIFNRIGGPDDVGVLILENDLAMLYMQQGRLQEASPLLEKLLVAVRELLGPRHTGTLAVMNNLASARYLAGNLPDAESLWKSTLAGLQAERGADNPQTLPIRMNLARLYTDQDRLDEAAPMFEKALEIASHALPAAHPMRGRLQTHYGLYLTKRRRFEDAERALLGANGTLAAALPPTHPQTLEARTLLADLYDAWGRPGEAERLRAAGREPAAP